MPAPAQLPVKKHLSKAVSRKYHADQAQILIQTVVFEHAHTRNEYPRGYQATTESPLFHRSQVWHHCLSIEIPCQTHATDALLIRPAVSRLFLLAQNEPKKL